MFQFLLKLRLGTFNVLVFTSTGLRALKVPFMMRSNVLGTRTAPTEFALSVFSHLTIFRCHANAAKETVVN